MRTSTARVIAMDESGEYTEAEIFQAIITLDLGITNAKATVVELGEKVQILKARVLAKFEPVSEPAPEAAAEVVD